MGGLLSLSMIVGGDNEAFEFERCMKSVKGELFDEIIIVMTKKSEKIKKIANRYATKVCFFEWCDDFAAARNFSLDQVKTPFMMWLDADDVIKPPSYRKLLELKKELERWDLIRLPYIYFHDQNDAPVNVLPRERIIRMSTGLRWEGPIHECIPYPINLRIKNIDDIFVDHYRTKTFSAERNIKILEKCYEKDPTPRISFYYGKDLLEAGRVKKGIEVLEKYVKKGHGSVDDLAAACIRLMQLSIAQNDFENAKKYAFHGISFSKRYAEFYTVLGELAAKNGEVDDAIMFFEESLTKNLDANFSQMIEYYREKPVNQLAILYYNKGDFARAFKYNRMAQLCRPNNVGLLSDRNKMVKGLIDFKVCWLINSLNILNPSVRIRRYNVHEHMKSFGFESEVKTNYYGKPLDVLASELDKFKVVIFTQYSEYEYKLIKLLKSRGKKVIFDHCEALFGFEMEAECMQEADAISCCSSKLAELTKAQGFERTVIIKDAIESREVEHTYEAKGDPLKAVYMGMGGNSVLAENLRPILEKAGYELVIISEWENATKKWNLNTWHEDLNEADVVLCPQRVVEQPAKSNVKVTTSMALGLPTLAAPIQSYQEVIQTGINGFICSTDEEWYNALIELKEEKRRKQIGTRAKASVGYYTLDAIANQWIDLFCSFYEQNIEKKEKSKGSATVDVIVANYNNSGYLKLCVDSIFENTSYPFRLIISDSGSNKKTWDYLNSLKGVTIVGEEGKRLNYSEACNAGIAVSFSKYFVILNSDVIVSKGWLKELVRMMDTVPRLACCGVYSNCDQGWLHKDKMKLKSGLELHPGMKRQEIEPCLDELDEFMTESNTEKSGQYVDREWVAVYATIFARSAINEIGGFDPEYHNGCEDLDLCIRLKKYKYAIGQALGSFIFHFGGVSRGAYEAIAYDQFHEEDKYNHERRKTKWEKEKIVIFTGPAFERWNKAKVSTGMGGSETWAVELASEFAKKGFEVTVYNDLDTEDYEEWVVEDDGVRYRHFSKLYEDLAFDCVDYFISSRTCSPFAIGLHALKKYVMIHDIWLSDNQNYNTHEWQIQKYAILSEWHKNFVMQHHRIPETKLMLTANGVDHSLYQDDTVQKKNKIFYSSSPDRGLDVLLELFPSIRREVPDLQLVVAYGFNNWEVKAKERNDLEALRKIEQLKEAMDQPGVTYLGRISKEELARHQLESKAWMYPTDFWETFCISAVEAGLAGCAILSSELAGLKTTVGDAGILINDRNFNQAYKDRFIQEAIRLLTDEPYRLEWAQKAYEKVKDYTWDKIADEWISEFKDKKLKLNLGCGGKKIDGGYIGCDIYEGENVDQVFSLDEVPYSDNTVDEIYSEHALEHLTFGGGEKALKEWFRVLKPNGRLLLKIPDLELCCQNYLTPPELKGKTPQQMKQWFKYTMFGIQRSLDGEPPEAQIHRSGYSKQEMVGMLQQVGFKVSSVRNYDGWGTPSMEIVASK